MSYIRTVKALEILDSRGNPTVGRSLLARIATSLPRRQCPQEHPQGKMGLELRDGDKNRYGGKGVQIAVDHVNGPIAQLLIGEHVFDQAKLDRMMVEADRDREQKPSWC